MRYGALWQRPGALWVRPGVRLRPGRSVMPDIPSWVPAAGASVTYTGGGSVLTNNWRSTHDDTRNNVFYSKKMNAAYSGFLVHPTWRGRGGLVFFGGGHANTNYNGGHVLTFGQDTLYFERLIDATDFAAADPDTGDVTAEYNSYGEVTASVGGTLQIMQGHSYGNGDIIDGKVERVIRQAFIYTGGGDVEAQAYHTLDLNNPNIASSARLWVRETNSTGAWSSAAPNFTAYSPNQNRIYLMDRFNGNLRWFDRSAKTWVTGSNATWGYPSADSDGGDPVTGVLFAVPERNLVVAAYRQGGNLVIQYIQDTTSQPSVSTATLGTTLALPVDGGKFVCWCSRSSRILVFGVTSNTDKVYEITIPATLTDTWTVANHTISGPAIDPVAIRTRSGWGCHYHDPSRTVMFPAAFVDTGNDSVTVYRPRNT